MVKEFKIKDERARDFLFQSPHFERWVKDKLGYNYFNNEFSELQYSDEITNAANSSKILTKTELFDEICRNPANFYNEVLCLMRMPCLIIVKNGNTLFIGDNEDDTTLLCHNDDQPTRRQIVYATGKFSDLNPQPSRWAELYNKFVEHVWNTEYFVSINLREDANLEKVDESKNQN